MSTAAPPSAGPRRIAAPRRKSRRPHLLALLPALLFLGFFPPNTRLPVVSELMLPGRWAVLLGVFAIALIAHRSGAVLKMSPSITILLLCFLNFGMLLPLAVNPVLAGAKWAVFAIFLCFCILVSSQIQTRDHIERILTPLVPIFIAYIWLNLVGPFFLSETRRVYGFTGMMKNANGLGLYLVLFALPLALYCLETATRDRERKLYLVTSGLATLLVLRCGSRTAAAAAMVMLAIGFWRWERFNGRRIQALKLLLISASVMTIPYLTPKIESFLYKYPDARTIFESRTPYWDATYQAFLERPWVGAGFGLQASESESQLGFATKNSQRRAEQGSSILGLLEEVGILGAVPFFLLLIVTAIRQILVLFLSHDALQILFARSILGGLIWAVAENYLLALGNAASILFFFSLFFSERLLQIYQRDRVAARQQLRAPLSRPRHPLPRPAGAF